MVNASSPEEAVKTSKVLPQSAGNGAEREFFVVDY
jgi:hypothetical protein